MKFIALFLIAYAPVNAPIDKHYRELIKLPLAESRFQVVDEILGDIEGGKTSSDIEQYEILLSISYNKVNTSPYIPKDIIEAAMEIEKILPVDVYQDYMCLTSQLEYFVSASGTRVNCRLNEDSFNAHKARYFDFKFYIYNIWGIAGGKHTLSNQYKCFAETSSFHGENVNPIMMTAVMKHYAGNFNEATTNAPFFSLIPFMKMGENWKKCLSTENS